MLAEAGISSNGYWACPVNIGGLEQSCAARLIEGDLFDLLRPSTPDLTGAFQRHRERGALSYGRFHRVVERRVADITAFLRQVRLSIDTSDDLPRPPAPVNIRPLSSDSHNGARRPLLIQSGDRRYVFKFADPRPHQLLSAILDELSYGIGVDLRPPEVIPGRDHRWYAAPFLAPDDHGGDVRTFMLASGALTAVAYLLSMVDLHLENVVVFQGKPVIVDPECILHNFPPDDRSNRLLSTGLLSTNPRLSALRGGDVARQEFLQVGLSERADGGVDYLKPAGPFHNRFRLTDGRLADPADYHRDILDGFLAAFEWFMRYRSVAIDIVDQHVADDFRIRFLVRTTRLYTTAIHLLNAPISCGGTAWRRQVFERLRRAGHFLETVSPEIMAAEWADIESRDVPYFWIHAGAPIIHHRSGAKQALPYRWNARRQAISDIRSLSRSEVRAQTDVLSAFLDADLRAPS